MMVLRLCSLSECHEAVVIAHTENEEFERNIALSTSMDFDPAYPQVLLLMVKWYWRTEQLGQHLKDLYPKRHTPHMLTQQY